MATASPPGPWHSLRGLPGRTPLRVKLIAAVLALVTAALVVISIAGIAVLRGYLLGQADDELYAAENSPQIPLIVDQYLSTGQMQPGYNNGISVQWLPATGPVQQVVPQFAVSSNGHTRQIPGPACRQGDSWLAAPGTDFSRPVTVSSATGSERWRVISSAATRPNPFGTGPLKGTIVVGVDVTNVYRTLNELTVIDVIVSTALLLVLAVLGVALVRSSLRPLTDIEQTAQAIAAGDLSRRVPERDPRTEVGKLGRALNLMLAQIEAAFRARTASEEAARRSEEAARSSALAAGRSEDRMRQFVADASHELRTPLTAIRGFAEYYRQRGGLGDVTGKEASPGSAEQRAPQPAAGRDATGDAVGEAAGPEASLGPIAPSELDRIIERVEQEAARMGVLVDDLLLLARLDQQRQPDFKTVDLLAIAADALHDARVIAPDRTINLTVATSDAPLVTGDEVSLRQVVGNLMSNAMTHTPDGSQIDITIRSGSVGDTGPAVILEVADAGPGLTDDQKRHVFERFYRTDRARSRSTTAGGTGLGLAIVAALVGAHSGRVWVDSEPGKGATFGFAIPLAPEAMPATS